MAPLIETALRTRMAETPQPFSPHPRSVVGEMIPVFCNGSTQGWVEWGRNHLPPHRPSTWAHPGGVGGPTILGGGVPLASNHGTDQKRTQYVTGPSGADLTEESVLDRVPLRVSRRSVVGSVPTPPVGWRRRPSRQCRGRSCLSTFTTGLRRAVQNPVQSELAGNGPEMTNAAGSLEIKASRRVPVDAGNSSFEPAMTPRRFELRSQP